MFVWQTASKLAGVRAEYRCSWDSECSLQRRGTGEAARGSRERRRRLRTLEEGSVVGLWSGSTVPCQHRRPLLLVPGSPPVPVLGPSASGSAPWGFIFIQNKAHVRRLNPVFKHIFLSVTLKMSPQVPRKSKWDFSCSSAPWAGYCLPPEILFYSSCFGQL